MSISIVGTGYVGLVTGACLAERGHDVTCVDVDRAKVDAINARRAPIHEDGLPRSCCDGTSASACARRPTSRAAVRDAEITFIAVGTPFDGTAASTSRYVARGGRGDRRGAARRRPSYHAVVVKSTVVPGTTDGVVRAALERGLGQARRRATSASA